MNRLVFCVLVGLIAAASAQFNSQQFPIPNQFQSQQFPIPNQQFPNIPDLCRQPGANCKVDSRFAEESSVTDNRGNNVKYTRVCDDRGCYDRKVYSGSSALAANFLLMTTCAVFVGVKIFFH